MKQNDRAIVLEAILSERERQDASFGEQNHDDSWWNLLITQRQGEVAKELFSYSETKLFIELIQTCATYMSWANVLRGD